MSGANLEKRDAQAAADGRMSISADSIAEPQRALFHLQRAQALVKERAAPGIVAKELTRFIDNFVGRANKADAEFVLNQAHIAHDKGFHDEAVVLYDWLSQNGYGGAKCAYRRATWRLEHNEPRLALHIVERVEASQKLDAQGVYIMARALLALNRPEDAIRPLKSIIAIEPYRYEIVRLLFVALEKTGSKDELRHADQFLGGLSPERRFEFLVRACISCDDCAGIARLFAEFPVSVTRPSVTRVGQVMQALIGKRDFDCIDALFNATGGVSSGCPSVVNAKLRAALNQRDYDVAEHILCEAEPLLVANPGSELCLRKIEYLCVTMQLDRATEYLAECTADRELPEGWTAMVCGLHSARGEWNKVIDLVENRVRLGLHIANAPTLHALMRAARFTGRYAQVLELADDLLSRAPNEELSNFRDRLVCELSLLSQADGSRSPPLQPEKNKIVNPLFAERERTLGSAVTKRKLDDGERHIYFCTDGNYLVGTCVALFSLLRNNLALRQKCAFNVICSDDVLDFATDIFVQIGCAFGVPIAVIPASTLLDSAYRLKTDWGLFAPALGLSDAAYYRIFAAQGLLARGARGKALYIDSDTWIGHGVDRILNFGLQSQPLGARPEVVTPEIARAAVRLGIEPADYFNSGVLLFDLEHSDLPAALARSIDNAVRRQEMLTFVDQCALNLAFRDCYAALPDQFNAVLLPTAAPDAITEEPVILHFIARPKPWDPMYSTSHCMRWIREFSMLAEVLPFEASRRLLMSQFDMSAYVPAEAAA